MFRDAICLFWSATADICNSILSCKKRTRSFPTAPLSGLAGTQSALHKVQSRDTITGASVQNNRSRAAVSARNVALIAPGWSLCTSAAWQMAGVSAFSVLLESCREISSNSSQRARTFSRYDETYDMHERIVAPQEATPFPLCRLHSRHAHKPGAQSVTFAGASSTKAGCRD